MKSHFKKGLPVYDTSQSYIITTKPALTLLTFIWICIDALKTTIGS